MIDEPEIQLATRAFATAQELLDVGAVVRTITDIQCSWHNTTVDPLRGCLGLVNIGGVLDDDADTGLVGSTVRVRYADRDPVVVYVSGGADLPYDFSLAFRPFVALAIPSTKVITVTLEVIE